MMIEKGFLQGLFKDVENNGLKNGIFRICNDESMIFEGVGNFVGESYGRLI